MNATTRRTVHMRYLIVVLLFLFMCINFADKAVLGLVAVPLMAELKITAEQFGMIAGSFFFLFAISGIIFGFIANRVASKPLLILMTVIWSVAQFPVAAGASTLGALIACRVLLGVGEGPAYPLALHSCYKWFSDKERNLPTAIVMQGGQVGLLLAGPLVAYLTLHYNWRAPFFVLGAIGLVWVVIWQLFGKEGTLVGDNKSVGPSVSDLGDVSEKPSYRRLLLERTFIGNSILYWVAYWSTALVFTWLPAYLQKGLNYSTTEAGWIFSLCIALSIPFVTITSYLSERLLRKGASSRAARGILVVVCIVLAAACVLTGVLFEGDRLIKALLIAGGLSMPQISFVLCAAIAAEISPARQRGAALAITNSVGTTAGLVAPIVMGHFVQSEVGTGGFSSGFLFTAALLLVGGILGWLMINPAKTLQSRQQSNARGVRDPHATIALAPTIDINH